MKNWNPKEIRARIDEVLPEGKVIPRHNEQGHFYEIDEAEYECERFFESGYKTKLKKYPPFLDGPTSGYNPPTNSVYPSVTGKIHILKDQGLMNYKMNRAIESLRGFIFANYKNLAQLVDPLPMEIIDKACETAGRVSQDILEDAGDIGTRIHTYREIIFNEWIKTGVRPADFTKFIPPEDIDVRAISGVRALQAFCEERDYIPIRCELLVYSHEDKTAGTLDDLGLIRKIVRSGNPDCKHEAINLMQVNESCVMKDEKGAYRCLKCDLKYYYEFVLMDIKTSNQLKDHYFFQVCIYWKYFWKLMGASWKPDRCIIVQLSKENGRYKVEDLKSPAKLAQYARHMIKTNEGVEFIKSLRKDNQKVVAPLMQL